MRSYLAAVGLVFALAACSNATPDSGGDGDSDGKKVDPTTELISNIQKVPTVARTVTLTEDNDPNDKLGRPGGYEAGAVFYDRTVEMCDAPTAADSNFGVACGATLEVWPDADSAKARSDFIESALKGANGMLGTEYNYLDGKYLLRVSGEVKPSDAKAYEAAIK